MGYYTDFEIIGYNSIEMADDLVKTSGYMWDDEYLLSDAKWYDYQENCEEVARRFPENALTLEGRGEEHGDHWRLRLKDGKVYKVVPQIDWIEIGEA